MLSFLSILSSIHAHTARSATDLHCHAGCHDGTSPPLPILDAPAPPQWVPLPLGSIAPSGWLLDQLVLQANSLSGFMPSSTFPGAIRVNQSYWTGGHAADHITQWLPYWSNGNVPLILLLRAAGDAATARLDPSAHLEDIVDGMMAYVLAHTNKTNGWIGPYFNEPGDTDGHGLWDPLNMLRSLLQYAEATPSSRRDVAAAVVRHLTAEAKLLKTDPVYKWASTRWPTFVQVCLYVIDHMVPLFGNQPDVMPLGGAGTTAMLMNASRLFRSKGMDWFAYYNRSGPVKFPSASVPNWNTNDHGVNNAEGALAWPAMDHRLGGPSAHANDSMSLVMHMLDTYQAQPNALFCADEVFCGRAPHRGTETCTVVESMASLEQAFAVLGTPNLMDRVESLAFNALPAALTADMWTHVYVQQANSVFAGHTHLSEEVDPSRRHHHLHSRHQENEYPPWVRSRQATHDAEHSCSGGGGSGTASCGAMRRRMQHDTPSGEDQSANYYGVSHFPCCITNFPQGWPKFAASAVLYNATANAFVIASLVPLNATMPASIGGGATLSINTSYPFGDVARVTVRVPSGHRTTAYVRIPGWALSTTVNGAAVANGTLTPVACGAGTTSFDVRMRPAVVAERGWGVLGERAASAIIYSDAELVDVPCSAEEDWDLSGGASLAQSRLPGGGMDIRSGNPGGSAWLVNRHPIYGQAHNVTGLSFGFSFIAGYYGKENVPASLSLHVLDMATRADLSGAIAEWPALTGYSYDHFVSYSPVVSASIRRLALANANPVLLAIKIRNNQRNLQIPLRNLSLALTWSPKATAQRPQPVSPYLSPAADAAIVRRGPLLFAVHPTESRRIVTSYDHALPVRPLAVDYEVSTNEPWAFALELGHTGGGEGSVTFDPTPSPGWSAAFPFNTDDYPFSVLAKVRALPETTWGYYGGSRITAQPPPSPLDCANKTCGASQSIRMVPFGGTNIRIAVLPWTAA